MTDNEHIPRIERGSTKIIVPHIEGEIKFIHPSLGPDSYQTVGRQILGSNLQVPDGNHTASLLHASYCSAAQSEPEFEAVRDLMKKERLWVFNRNLWTSAGLFVVRDYQVIGLAEELNPTYLDSRLEGGKELSWGE